MAQRLSSLWNEPKETMEGLRLVVDHLSGWAPSLGLSEGHKAIRFSSAGSGWWLEEEGPGQGQEVIAGLSDETRLMH